MRPITSLARCASLLVRVCRQNISDIWFGDKRVCGSSGLEVQAAIAC